jgi:hypothetical protein
MYTMTTLEGTFLALAVVATATLLVLGVLIFFPRVMQTVTARVECPLIRRRATAQFARDEWTRRLVDVTCCSVLGTSAVPFCRKGCLPAAARGWRITRG